MTNAEEGRESAARAEVNLGLDQEADVETALETALETILGAGLEAEQEPAAKAISALNPRVCSHCLWINPQPKG